jgi:hypothetical protein
MAKELKVPQGMFRIAWQVLNSTFSWLHYLIEF